MSVMTVNDLHLYYQLDGDKNAPALILSNSLGTNLDMWQPQLAALSRHFHVVRYDTRGHGQSSVTPGPYRIAQLGEDVIALMDHLHIERAHFCGLSMGGMTGMWLGANRPARINHLALCNTAALIGPAEIWNNRIAKVSNDGMGAIVQAVLERWFTPEFLASAPQQVAVVSAMLEQMPAAGYTASCAAVRDMDQREGLAGIRAPTLVIAGTQDKATPPQDGKLVADRIPGARYVELNAAHLSNWERAEEFTRQLLDFLLLKA